MGCLWDILYDVVFQPRVAMRNIAAQKNIGQALLVTLASLLIPIWAFYFEIRDTSMATMMYMMIGVKIVGSIFMWVIGAAVWNLIAELFGGKGSAAGLFAALGFAHIPRMFIIPLWALIAVLPASGKTGLMTLAVLIILCWSLSLDVVAIKEVHQLSTAKTVIVMIMPMLIVGAFLLIGCIFISNSLMHMPMWV